MYYYNGYTQINEGGNDQSFSTYVVQHAYWGHLKATVDNVQVSAGTCNAADGAAALYVYTWTGKRSDGTTVEIKDAEIVCRTGEIALDPPTCPPYQCANLDCTSCISAISITPIPF